MKNESFKPYHFVRYRWWTRVDLAKASKDLKELFNVQAIEMPRDRIEIVKDEKDELRVKADTLWALLSPFRAVLYQREAAPFTRKDIELRKKMMELYPKERSSPLPLFFKKEPKFEVTERVNNGRAS